MGKMRSAERIDYVDTIIEMAGFIIGYWATKPCVVDEDEQTYTITVQDEFVGDFYGEPRMETILPTYTLTYAQIHQAAHDLFERWSGKEAKILRDDWRNNDGSEIDSPTADSIIQWAAFGTVVFG